MTKTGVWSKLIIEYISACASGSTASKWRQTKTLTCCIMAPRTHTHTHVHALTYKAQPRSKSFCPLTIILVLELVFWFWSAFNPPDVSVCMCVRLSGCEHVCVGVCACVCTCVSHKYVSNGKQIGLTSICQQSRLQWHTNSLQFASEHLYLQLMHPICYRITIRSAWTECSGHNGASPSLQCTSG